MRFGSLLFIGVLLFASCSTRECACEEDIHITWKEEIEQECWYLLLPNAMINDIDPFVIVAAFSEKIEWKNQSLKLFQDDNILLDVDDLSPYAIKDHIIRIPNEIFSKSNGEKISGIVHVEGEISFPQHPMTATIEGSIYVYNREEVENDFNPEDCRWPMQIIEFNNPC